MRTSIAIGLSLSLVGIAAAVHADTVNMTVKSVKQGDIKGSVTIKGREGSMECSEFGLEVATPRDANGVATGKRQYKPVRCVKRVDRASPLLFKALVTNEVLTSVVLQAWSSTSTREGQFAQTYTVALKSANVTGLRQFLDAKGVLMEEVTFAFASIAVTWVDGGISAEDSVRATN